MRTILSFTASILTLVLAAHLSAEEGPAHGEYRILLVAGETAKVDKPGHHDYLAGCKCLDVLLARNEGVTVEHASFGWPRNEQAFADADAVVFYTDGGGKQAFLANPERIARMNQLADAGVGLVMIHQAVDFPKEFAKEGKAWLGGIYLDGTSGRGHWDSSHVDFPDHSITRGVTPWHINDGWLNKIDFVAGQQGIAPLVWSGKEYAGSRAGLDNDIVAWAYERPGQGRSFSFTGLDAHSAWSQPGMRQLVVNGVLWSAGMEIPAEGARCNIDENQLNAMLTPRTPK